MAEKERFFKLLHEFIVMSKRARASRILCKKTEKYIKKMRKLRIERDLINGMIEDYEKLSGETIGRLR